MRLNYNWCRLSNCSLALTRALLNDGDNGSWLGDGGGDGLDDGGRDWLAGLDDGGGDGGLRGYRCTAGSAR